MLCNISTYRMIFFQSGKISKEINFLPYELREKLNEIKKEEIHRLRKLVQAKNTVEKGLIE